MMEDPHQIVQLVVELKKQLDKERTLACLQREKDAIAREQYEREKDALAHVNGNLLKQIQALCRAGQRNTEGAPLLPPSPSKRPNDKDS